MIISCPACSTRYSIDPVPLGDGGKSVRCAKCGEKWHQTPELVAPQPQPQPQPEPESELESEAESPAQAAEDQAAEDQAAEDQAAEDQAAEPEAEEAPAEDKDLSQDDLDNLFDEAPAEEAPAEDEDAAAEDAEKEKSLSQNDLDDMFDQGSDKDEETPAPEKDEESGEESDEESDAGAPDTVEVPKDLPDAELMPEVFMVGSSDDEEEGARGGAGKIVGVIAAVLVVGLLAGAYFGRDRIVAVWPETESFYAMLGASSPLGAGLDIRGVKWERTSERGKALLVIRGIIANVDDDTRPVPWIQVTLYDASNDELRRLVFPPEKDQVAGGQSMNFKARVEEPPVTARRLEVTFTHAIDKVGG